MMIMVSRRLSRRRRTVSTTVAALVLVSAMTALVQPAGPVAAVPVVSSGSAAEAVIVASGVPRTLSAPRAHPRRCFSGPRASSGTDGFTVTAPVTGLVRVRLDPVNARSRSGDWDVAIFRSGDSVVVGASAGPRSYEVADGFVTEGERLWVQGCRYAGTASRVAVSVVFARAAGGSTTSTTAPTSTTSRKAAQPTARSGTQLPSGRTTFRRLYDYDYEMKELARRHPGLVRLDVLSRQSYEGRDITAIEITPHPNRLGDGKPIFLDMGLLHAREWPSGELPMEFAYDLVQKYGHYATITRLLRRARTIVLPVVNPDGFSVSRQAQQTPDPADATYELKRKNCDPAGAPSAALRSGLCPANPAGADRGTDLNRNFGVFWGGAGSPADWSDQSYRGAAPFSEPETQAIRELASSRQITNVIGNHTAGDTVLRPPGLASAGLPVDDVLLSSLGRTLASHNRYADLRIYQFYDAGGGSDDWFYWVSGALSYSFEIGISPVRPDFRTDVAAEYLGLAPAAGAGHGGDRAAYLAMLAATAKPSDHAVLTGRAPKGWTLTASKTFRTPTSPVIAADGTTGPARLVTDRFATTFTTPGGRFSWAVNPSTRPYVAGRYGRTAVAPPQATTTLVNPPGQPALNENGDATSGPREIVPFTIAAPPKSDNGSATVRISWQHPDTSWFLFVFDDLGSMVGQTYPFGQTSAEITLPNPRPGRYTAVMVNFQQAVPSAYDDWSGTVSFAAPDPPTAGVREAWTLTCRRPGGQITSVRQVIVDRGHRAELGDVCRRSW